MRRIRPALLVTPALARQPGAPSAPVTVEGLDRGLLNPGPMAAAGSAGRRRTAVVNDDCTGS